MHACHPCMDVCMNVWIYECTSSTRTRRGGSCLKDIYIYIRPFSSIELACALRQAGACARALCEAVAVLLSKMTCATPVQCNGKRRLSSHFTLRSSHFTLDTSSHLRSCELFSPHLTSSQLFSSHPIASHMSSKKVLLNCFHLIRALINLSHLGTFAILSSLWWNFLDTWLSLQGGAQVTLVVAYPNEFFHVTILL